VAAREWAGNRKDKVGEGIGGAQEWRGGRGIALTAGIKEDGGGGSKTEEQGRRPEEEEE
jgi:hypothetical protein